MKSDRYRINIPVQYFGSLVPWVVDICKKFTMSDLADPVFGPKHCQIIQDENKTDCEGSSIKVITDGEVLINAVFTLNSIHNFNQRFGTDSTWQKKVLMLEIFKINYVESDNEFGDIVIKIEQFCHIGDAKCTADKSPFQLYWANTEPVVKEACQKMWKNKLLREASGTLEFIEDSPCSNTTFKSTTGNFFLYDICSARNILIASIEEKQALNSLSGWSKENNTSTLKNCCTFNKELKSKNDAIIEKVPLSKCNNNDNNNQMSKRNQSKTPISNYQVKHSDHCINEGTNKAEVIISPEDNQRNRTACETKVQGNTQDSGATVRNTILHNNGSCAYSSIKDNSEKEQQLTNLQVTNKYSTQFSLLQDDFAFESDINEDVSVDHQHMEKQAEQSNKNNLFLHKTTLRHKSDSVLNFSQDEYLDSFCDGCKGRNECKHCDNSELFHTQYYTPALLADITENSFETRSCCNEDSIFTNTETNSIHKITVSSRNKSKCDLNSCLSRIGEQKMVDISDHSASKLTNVKRLKVSCSQKGSKTGFNNKICNVQSPVTSFSDTKKTEGCLGNLCLNPFPVNTPSSSKTTLGEMGPGSLKPEHYQRSNHQSKAGLSDSVQKFDWSFSEVHIDNMWSRMVELILEKANQT